MASTKRRVRFKAIIRGQGGEAECTVWATEVTSPGVPPAYATYEIDSVSKPLPDGDYTVSVNDESHPVRRMNGHWLARP